MNHPAKWCHKYVQPNATQNTAFALTLPRLPDNVSLELGAIVEPLSVAMHAYDRARLPDNATVLVIGAGAIGLLCAAVVRATGHEVVIADIQEDRVRFATDHGFAHAGVVVPARRPVAIEDKLAYAQEVAELVKAAQVQGKAVGQVNATFECTGVETCMQTAIYVRFPVFLFPFFLVLFSGFSYPCLFPRWLGYY